jgi:hypothetical protein
MALDENRTVVEDDRDTLNFQLLLNSFIVLLQRERTLLNYIFPQQLQGIVFAKLVEPSMKFVKEQAIHLCQAVERLTNKVDTAKFSIYGFLAILKWFPNSRPLVATIFQVMERLCLLGHGLFTAILRLRKRIKRVVNNSSMSRRYFKNRLALESRHASFTSTRSIFIGRRVSRKGDRRGSSRYVGNQ